MYLIKTYQSKNWDIKDKTQNKDQSAIWSHSSFCILQHIHLILKILTHHFHRVKSIVCIIWLYSKFATDKSNICFLYKYFFSYWYVYTQVFICRKTSLKLVAHHRATIILTINQTPTGNWPCPFFLSFFLFFWGGGRRLCYRAFLYELKIIINRYNKRGHALLIGKYTKRAFQDNHKEKINKRQAVIYI